MQISMFSDYALRVLIHLAFAGENLRTTRQIAEHHGASFNHLAKISQWLTSEGYVAATRGRSGGLTLAKAPADIAIGELLRKTEQGAALVECMREDGGTCVFTPACGLPPILLRAEQAFFAVLDEYTLEDITTANPRAAALLKALMPQ